MTKIYDSLTSLGHKGLSRKYICDAHFPHPWVFCVNSLWPSDAIWWHRSGSTLAQVMACYLGVQSHYLNQCWIIIKMILLHSPANNFTSAHKHYTMCLEIVPLKLLTTCPRSQLIKGSLFFLRNPVGRTGICHRGTLGRWGPNHAADPIVTRWRRNKEGEKVFHEASNRAVLQFIAIKRRDSGQWAIPGVSNSGQWGWLGMNWWLNAK